MNVGARSSLIRLLRRFVPRDPMVQHVWFVIDYQRPFAQLYVEQTLRDLHDQDTPGANNVLARTENGALSHNPAGSMCDGVCRERSGGLGTTRDDGPGG